MKSAAETNLFSDFELDMLKDLKEKARLRFCGLPWATRVIIAGGAFTSWYHGVVPKDVDVFVLAPDEESHENILETYRKEFPWLKQQLSEYRKEVNPNITDVWGSDQPGNIQLIFTKYKTRKELIEHFDYVHAMVSYGYEDNKPGLDFKLFISKQTLDCIRDKKLVINNKDNWRQYRESKFVKRGWTVADKDRIAEIEKEDAMPWYQRSVVQVLVSNGMIKPYKPSYNIYDYLTEPFPT